MRSNQEEGDRSKEGRGWLTLTAFIFIFPALFFLVVFLPMWMGWTSRW